MNEGEERQEERVMQGEPIPMTATVTAGTGAGAETHRQGRRVTLRRDAGGSYQILMRDQVVQGFCDQFEEITRWRMPRDTQLQARIFIQPVGRLCRAVYIDRVEGGPEAAIGVQERLEHGPVPIPEERSEMDFGMADVAAVGWRAEALEYLRREWDQMARVIDTLENIR